MPNLSTGWNPRATGLRLRAAGGGRSSAALACGVAAAGAASGCAARGLRGVVRGGGRSSGASWVTARGGGL